MNLLQFDSTRSWVDGVATFWQARLRAQPRLRLCLTSGNTPLPVYQAIADLAAQGFLSFREASLFALDEYGGLPASDEGRCANILRRYLVDRVDLTPSRFHCLNPDAPDLDRVCRDYDSLIGHGFDLALLGLGLNGHLGLNEPGSAPESPTRRVEMHPSSTAAAAQYVRQNPLPRWGLTVGLEQLLGSREVWLLVTGRSKAEVLRQVLRGPIGPEVPASLLRRHRNCCVFYDAEAGALL